MKYLSEYMQAKQTAAFNKYGAFFAFSNKQFDEGKKEGIKYANMGHGLICPADNCKPLFDELEQIHMSAIAQDVAENGAAGIITREYFNTETQIHGDTEELRDNLARYFELHPDQFTNDLFKKVCKSAFRTAVKNDWF